MIALVASLLATSSVLVGTKVPSLELDFGFPPSKVNLAERVAGKKVIIVGLPGAFTPT
jgi:2-Cys peroxiredoxin 5